MKILNSVKKSLAKQLVRTANRLTNSSASTINFGGSSSTFVSRSGAGGVQDRSAGFFVNYLSPATMLFPRQLQGLYEKDWQVEKIVKIVVDDAMRVPWEYKGLTEDQSRAVRAFEKKLGLPDALHTALIWERLYGRAAIVLGISDNIEDPTTPAGEGDLEYIYPVSGQLLYAGTVSTDPLSPGFGKPNNFRVNSIIFDKSRVLVFNGGSIKIPGMTNAGGWGSGDSFFGHSVIQPLFNDLVYATASRSGAFHLLQLASCLMLTGDFQAMRETDIGEEKMKVLNEMMREMSIYNASFLDTKSTDAKIETVNANFSAVPELMSKYLDILAAASDIPISRFMGSSPGGLNTNGDGDLKNYHVKIDSIRQKKIKPVIERILEFANRQVLGGKVDLTQVEIEFLPLSPKSDIEAAQIDSTRATTLATLTTGTGILTLGEGRTLGKDWGMYEFTDEEFNAEQAVLDEQDTPEIGTQDSDNGDKDKQKE